jgi:hypothetical protein
LVWNNPHKLQLLPKNGEYFYEKKHHYQFKQQDFEKSISIFLGCEIKSAKYILNLDNPCKTHFQLSDKCHKHSLAMKSDSKNYLVYCLCGTKAGNPSKLLFSCLASKRIRERIRIFTERMPFRIIQHSRSLVIVFVAKRLRYSAFSSHLQTSWSSLFFSPNLWSKIDHKWE